MKKLITLLAIAGLLSAMPSVVEAMNKLDPNQPLFDKAQIEEIGKILWNDTQNSEKSGTPKRYANWIRLTILPFHGKLGTASFVRDYVIDDAKNVKEEWGKSNPDPVKTGRLRIVNEAINDFRELLAEPSLHLRQEIRDFFQELIAEAQSIIGSPVPAVAPAVVSHPGSSKSGS